MRTLFIAIALIIILGGGWYWYSQQTPDTMNVNVENNDPFGSNTDTNTPGGTEISVDGSVSTGAIKEFTVTNSGMTFVQKALSVKKGDRVKITFNNVGGTHDFRIEGYNVGTKVVQAGQSETFEFVADRAGSFEYFCSVGNHRANGMIGTLTVTP
ncbi:MAG: plastocyanin/azurin family copper-binding protein [Patescibacteria group bacterium]